jgi:hypothetical protein
MSQFLTNINLKGNELLNAVIHNSGTAPTDNAKTGGIYTDTNGGANALKFYNGTAWKTVTLGVIGTDIQAYDGDLAAIAALTGTSGLLKKTAANTWELDTSTYLTSSTGVTSVNGDSGAITNVAKTTDKLSVFAATSSSELAGVLSDETGSGVVVFSTSPQLTTSITTNSTTFALLNTTATTINFGGAATAINIGDASGTVTIAGNLTVNGTTTTVNSTTITVDDKNLELGSTASPSDAGADGGGITLKGTTDKTWNWIDATDSWTSSEHINMALGKVLKINGTEVLSASQYTGNAATATTATNVTGGAAGSLVYQTGSGTTSTLALGTSGYVLTSNGTTAPQWSKKKHVATLSSGTNSYSVTHGLGTSDVIAQLQIASTGEVVYADITTTSTTTTVTFASNTAVDYTLVLIA